MEEIHRLFLRGRSEGNKNKIRPIKLLYYGQSMVESRVLYDFLLGPEIIPLQKIRVPYV